MQSLRILCACDLCTYLMSICTVITVYMFTTHICAYSIGVFGVVRQVWRLASWEIYIMCSQDMSVNAFKCLFLVVPLGWFWPKAGLATDELGPRNEDGCHSHGHSTLDWWICFSLFKKTVCIICFVLWVSILAVLAWQKFLHCSIFWGAGTAGCLSLDTGWVPSAAAQLQRYGAMDQWKLWLSVRPAASSQGSMPVLYRPCRLELLNSLNFVLRNTCVLHDRDS